MTNQTIHYLVVANGDFLPAAMMHKAAKDKMIIALDEAADKLYQMGIMPHILLGDFDTDSESHKKFWGIKYTLNELSDTHQPYTGNHGVTIVPKKNQNLTDLMKAIQYCDEHKAMSITIICATGGRLDHHEAALRSLRVYYKKDREMVLHTAYQTLRFIKDDSFVIKGKIHDPCAILAFPKAVLTSHGLTYDVTDYKLIFGYSESISNSLRLSSATVHIKGEALLMLPSSLSSAEPRPMP